MFLMRRGIYGFGSSDYFFFYHSTLCASLNEFSIALIKIVEIFTRRFHLCSMKSWATISMSLEIISCLS